MKHIGAVIVVLLGIAGAVYAGGPENSNRNGDRTVFVRLGITDMNDETVIARSGPLSLLAVCSDNPTFGTVLALEFTSEEDDWYASFRGGAGFAAGHKESIGGYAEGGLSPALPLGSPRYWNYRTSDGFPPKRSAISPTGHFLTIDFEELGFGFNLYGSDCILTGEVITGKEQGP